MEARVETNRKEWTALSSGALLFGVLVCAWTASHSIPYFVRTGVGSMRVIAIIGVLSAEAFALWALYRKLRYAGVTGEAAQEAMLVMLCVIGLNVIVANVQASGTIRAENVLLQIYARYLAVVAFAVVIVWGKLHMIKHDQTQREADADANERAMEVEFQLSVQGAIAREVNKQLHSPDVQSAIEQAAQSKAIGIVSDLTGVPLSLPKPKARMELTAAQPIVVEKVEAIDDGKDSAQYVNGKAGEGPKGQPLHH